MRLFERARQSGDIVLLVVTAILILVGFIILASATSAIAHAKFNGDSYYFVKSQALHLLIGIIVFWAMARVNYHYWRKSAWLLWVISVGLLIAVFIPPIGVERNNAHSWLAFGNFSFQPVELVKILFIIYLATWLSEKSMDTIRDWRKGFVPFIFIAGTILFLILLQPDFGSMILLGLIAITIFAMSGASLKQLFALSVMGFVSLVTMVLIAPNSRFNIRLTSFLQPGFDTADTGYHLHQALIAIGSGGWWGRGFGKSVQKFYYLPEVAGDSIFAVMAEELGFIAVVIFILLFIMLLYRGIYIASHAPDVYGKLLALGLISWILWQSFLNIGSIIGLLPLTGLPLPFISQGGTALVTSLAAIGILFNISKHGVKRQ